MSKKIWLIGMGCGPDNRTIRAEKAIQEAELLIGSERMLGELTDASAQKTVSCKTMEIYSIIKECEADRIGVLYSGDAGFYSGAEALGRLLRQKGYETEIIPGISSVSYFASKLGVSWHGAYLESMHGRKKDLAEALQRSDKVFFLTTDGNDPGEIGKAILEREGTDNKYRIAVGERLGYEDERISTYDPAELEGLMFDDLNVVFVQMAGEDFE